MKKRDRATYQKEYHAKDPEAAANRKDKERAHRIRAAAYWRFKLYLGRDMPALINGLSQEIVDQEEAEYRKLLNEPVEVVTSE